MVKRKLRKAFGLFLLVTFLSGVGGVLYLQSTGFAEFVKRMISEHSSQKLGVVGDFKNLKLYFFPPGIGIAGPTMQIEKNNIAKIPVTAKIEAKEIRISFAPIQMFSGTLAVDEFKVVGGSVIGTLGNEILKPAKKKDSSTKLGWNDLLHLQINGIHLEDTYLHLDLESMQASEPPSISSELVVKDLVLRKSEVDKKPGFTSQAIVSAVKLNVPKSVSNLPIKEAYQVQWDMQWNDEGIKFSPFAVDIEGLNLKLHGRISGNVLDEKSDLRIEAETQLSSNLAIFFSNHLQIEDWAGDVQGVGKLTGRLRDLEHTLKASYQLTGKDIAWNDMRFAFLQGEGNVNLPNKKIEMKSLNLIAPEPEGGEVTVVDTTVPLQEGQAFDALVKLKKADLHWLGGAVIKDIYNLEGLVSGEVRANFLPAGKNWKLTTHSKLEVENFALNNQKWGKPRPKHYILRPKLPIKLSGETVVGSGGVDFNHMTAELDKIKLDIQGGVRDKEGLVMTGAGPVDLKEMNEIAEIPIRGAGDLKLTVRGKNNHTTIDFDADLKNTEYLKINFGDLKGRITYDDEMPELRFKNIKAHQRSTNYSLTDGYIDLSGSDELHLPITINSGRVQDLTYIMDDVVKKVSWFPTTLTGEVHGSVEISGKTDLPHLEIGTHLEGADWSWMNERARKIKMDFGYNRGDYYARNVNLTKTNGQVLGFIEFNTNTEIIKWNFHTENFTLQDIDFVDRLEVPARSKIMVTSSGQGKPNQIQSTTDGKMFDTVLKGDYLEPTTVSMVLGEKTMNLKVDVFGNRLHSQVKYAFTPKQPSQFSLDLNQFDFTPLLVVLNPKLMDDPELRAKIDGHVHLDFLSTQSELARGSITLKEYLLQKNGFYLKLAQPIELPIQLGFFNLPPTQFQFKNSEFKISGDGSRGNVDLYLVGNLDMAIAEFFSSSIQKIQGVADTHFHMYGPLKDLKVVGDIKFEGAYALMRWLQTPFEEIDGAIRFRQGTIYIEGFESYLADELFYLSGTIDTFTDRFPKLDLKAQFEDNKIKLPPLDYVQVRGSTWIHGDAPPYLISGNIDMLQGLWTKSFGDTAGISARGDRFAPTKSENQSSSMFNLDLNVVANQAFFVRNEIMDAEFRGKVKMLGPPDDPKMLGEGQLVQGKILFRDRPFNLESVNLIMDDPLQFNPKYSVSAISEVNQYKIRLLASGRGSQVRAEFSSSPFLPENEIYSLLTSGMTSSDSGRFRATRDRTYVNQGEAASLILHSMDFSQDIQRKTGFQFDVQEAIDQQSATSIFRQSTPGENVAAPKVVIKRNVGRSINLSFGSTVGVGTETIREANAEYMLTPGMSFIGVWNDYEGVNTKETRTSYGLDIRLNKKFK